MVPRISAKQALVPRPFTLSSKHATVPKSPFVPKTTTAKHAGKRGPMESSPSPSVHEPAKTKGENVPRDRTESDEDRLDPAARSAMLLAPPPSAAPTPTPAFPLAPSATAARTAEAHALASAMVERAAFWGDGTRGLARLRFGANARHGLSGATVVLEHDGDKIALRIEDGEDDTATAKLVERLRARGLEIE